MSAIVDSFFPLLALIWQPQFVVPYAGAMVLTFVATFWWLPRAQPFAERCLDSFGAASPTPDSSASR
jgi:hypothetical protein